MAAFNNSDPRSDSSGVGCSALGPLMRMQEEVDEEKEEEEEKGSREIRQRGADEQFLLQLPTAEQMQKDVANATYELQQTFFCPQNRTSNSDCESQRQYLSEEFCSPAFQETSNASNEVPLRRTQEETVCEELIINGKKYRQTFQRRVVLESQKTREIFMLPSGFETEHQENGCASSNFDRYNRAFRENGTRSEGDFSPILVIPPPIESPRSVCPPNLERSVPETTQRLDSPIVSELSKGKFDHSPALPLVISHMYHFGEWGKTASILDPRLPASLGIPLGASQQEDSIFYVVPAQWHHSDITYDREAFGAPGVTAKARIVACLQRFTQRSTHTGKQLYRGTYVQHTKIARWRRSEKYDEIPPASAITDEGPKVPPLPQENGIENVANVSEIWKQVPRSPLGGEEGAVKSFPQLRPCPYDRLQLLQSLCPVAAAAIMILGRQMPEIRSNNCSMPTRHPSAVTADAWIPRSLIIPDSTEKSSLLFSMPDGPSEVDSTSRSPTRLLRGGTLDGLLVYALNIFRQNKSDTYDSLIPNIFMRLYPTFAVANEVVSRLIQRYLSLVPIEPGGLGGIMDTDEKEEEVDTTKEVGREWKLAISTLKFLLKLLARTERCLLDSKLENKLLKFALLLQLDSRIVSSQTTNSNTCVIDEDDFPVEPTLENAVSIELNQAAKFLMDLVSPASGSRFDAVASSAKKSTINKLDHEATHHTCACHQRLNQFLRIRVKELAKQITAMEEAFFDGIQLYELINIKNLERGNTPTLSCCVQFFNDLNFMVKCLALLAKELGQPSGSVTDASLDSSCVCCLCGLQKEPLLQKRFMDDNQQRVRRMFVDSRKSIPRRYLCMSSASHSISLRVKRIDFQLENTLVQLCDLAEELKRMNNFSSFLAVTLGLQNAPTQNVSKRTKCRLDELSAYMLPPNFSAYRRDLEAAKMPCLPYLGLVFQQLIHLDSGNLVFLPSASEQGESSASRGNSAPITGDEADASKIVNFWRCWKHYLILGYFMKKADQDTLSQDEKGSYEIEADPEIQSYLNSFKIYSSKLGHNMDFHLGQSNRCHLKKQRSKSVNFHTLP